MFVLMPLQDVIFNFCVFSLDYARNSYVQEVLVIWCHKIPFLLVVFLYYFFFVKLYLLFSL